MTFAQFETGDRRPERGGWMPRVRGALERLFEWSNAIASLWIFGLMFLVTGDVLGRELSGVASWLAGRTVNLAIRGTPEIVKLSIVGIVFLQVAHALRKGRHVRSTVLVSRVPPRAAEALTLAAHLLGAVLCALIIWSSWDNMVTAWQIGEYEGEGALRVPVAPSRTLIIVGSAMFGSQFLILAFENAFRFKQMKTRGKPE
jgi:TRAP-type C4-dicarboxylate transport system permease small subunit